MDARLRNAVIVFSSSLASLLSATALAQDRAPEPVLPQQVLPTGEEDSPRAASLAAGAAQRAAQTPEDALREMTSESVEGLDPVYLGDGTVGFRVEGRFMSVVIATPTADGRFELSCHSGEDARTHAAHAADMLAGRAPLLPVAPQPVSITDQQPVLEEK
jgi:hypothetical protein